MSKVQCPICDAAMPGNWTEYPDYPFCSARCRKIDLGRWLDQRYRVPDPTPPDADDRSSSGGGADGE